MAVESVVAGLFCLTKKRMPFLSETDCCPWPTSEYSRPSSRPIRALTPICPHTTPNRRERTRHERAGGVIAAPRQASGWLGVGQARSGLLLMDWLAG